MSFKSKPMLLILQINQTLLYINNTRSKLKDFSSEKYKINYDVDIDNYKLLFRNGRAQLIEYLFSQAKNDIQIAVWTNLDAKLGQIVCQKYFGRYYRDLLFVLPTNRGLYSNATLQPQNGVKIPKDLNAIYTKFPGYNSTNTLVLTSLPNAIPQHTKNDMLIQQFCPTNQTFEQDVGCLAISKYVKGIVYRVKTQTLRDVRLANTGKPLELLVNRMTHRNYSDAKYL